MTLIRNTTILLVTFAVTALVVSGCSKDEATTDKSTADGVGKTTKVAKGSYAIFPKDANVVISLDLPAITSSPLYTDFAAPLVEAQSAQQLGQLQRLCNIDPLKEFERLTIGAAAASSAQPDQVVMSVTGPAREKLTKCGTTVAEEEGEKVEITNEGDFTKVTSQGQTMWFGWIDKNTFVGGPKARDKASIEAILTGKDGLDQNQAMMDLVGKVDTTASAWFAMRNADAATPVQGVPVQFKSVQGALSLKDGLHLDAGLVQASPEEAQQMVNSLTNQLSGFQSDPVGKFLAKMELNTSGSEVQIKLDLTSSEVNELVAAAKAHPMVMMLTGGAMGGMGGGAGQH